MSYSHQRNNFLIQHNNRMELIKNYGFGSGGSKKFNDYF